MAQVDRPATVWLKTTTEVYRLMRSTGPKVLLHKGRKRSTGQEIDPLTETVDRPTSSTGRLALACFHPPHPGRPAGQEGGQKRAKKFPLAPSGGASQTHPSMGGRG
jgi:hypothetical protein